MKRSPLVRRAPIARKPFRSKGRLRARKPVRLTMAAKEKSWMRIMPDGREILNTRSKSGRVEYRGRVVMMLVRQRGICCLNGVCPTCPGRLSLDDATFEHQDGRRSWRGRDDRIILPDGRWINGAAHLDCNEWKGSRRLEYHPCAVGQEKKAA